MSEPPSSSAWRRTKDWLSGPAALKCWGSIWAIAVMCWMGNSVRIAEGIYTRAIIAVTTEDVHGVGYVFDNSKSDFRAVTIAVDGVSLVTKPQYGFREAKGLWLLTRSPGSYRSYPTKINDVRTGSGFMRRSPCGFYFEHVLVGFVLFLCAFPFRRVYYYAAIGLLATLFVFTGHVDPTPWGFVVAATIFGVVRRRWWARESARGLATLCILIGLPQALAFFSIWRHSTYVLLFGGIALRIALTNMPDWEESDLDDSEQKQLGRLIRWLAPTIAVLGLAPFEAFGTTHGVQLLLSLGFLLLISTDRMGLVVSWVAGFGLCYTLLKGVLQEGVFVLLSVRGIAFISLLYLVRSAFQNWEGLSRRPTFSLIDHFCAHHLRWAALVIVAYPLLHLGHVPASVTLAVAVAYGLGRHCWWGVWLARGAAVACVERLGHIATSVAGFEQVVAMVALGLLCLPGMGAPRPSIDSKLDCVRLQLGVTLMALVPSVLIAGQGVLSTSMWATANQIVLILAGALLLRWLTAGLIALWVGATMCLGSCLFYAVVPATTSQLFESSVVFAFLFCALWSYAIYIGPVLRVLSGTDDSGNSLDT